MQFAECEVANRHVSLERVDPDISFAAAVDSPNVFVLFAVENKRFFTAHPVCVLDIEFVHMGNTTQAA